MRIALATCSNLPDWEVDDRPLHAAFAEFGVDAPVMAWDDPDVDWTACDACLLRTTWDYQERRDEFLAWAERTATRTLLLNPIDIVRWNTHKSYLRDLESRGVPIAPTVWFAQGETVDLQRVLAERGWPQAFLKPAIGATARETMRFGSSQAELAAAQAHLDRMLMRDDMLLQPYLNRVETEGELSAIFIDDELTHAVRKIPVPGDYRVQDDFGARDEPVELAGHEFALARRTMDAVGARLLYGRVDFLRNDAGELYVSELELVEPSLFFRHGPHAAVRLAAACRDRIAHQRALTPKPDSGATPI